MTIENQKLRDSLKDAETIIVSALRSQPEKDVDCQIHLKKAIYNVLHTVSKAIVSETSRPIDEIVKNLRVKADYNIKDGKKDTSIGMETMGYYQADLADRIEKAIEAERAYTNENRNNKEDK